MSDRAWDMLRAQFEPDKRGRFKTVDAMKIASQLAEENEKLKRVIDELASERRAK